MSQGENKIKIEKFRMSEVFSMYEEMEDFNYTLKALGLLLESSNLNYFAEDLFDDAWLYRKGLRNIIELFLGRQEQTLKKIKSKTVATPEWLIEQAEDMCERTWQGCWANHDIALEKTRREIDIMSEVVEDFGEDKYPAAQRVLDELLNLHDGIQSRIDAQKVAKIAEEADYRQAVAARQRKAATEN